MALLELNELLPSSQWEPNWTFYGAEHDGLSNDAEYVVFEYYCDNPACHCQKLTADIMKLGDDGEPIKQSLAVINYDWSSKALQCEPTLAEESPQTDTALHILEVYKKFIHHPEYLARIKDHYARVKQLGVKKGFKKTAAQETFYDKKMGRNDLCPCGSNKKYKKCCLHTKLSQDM